MSKSAWGRLSSTDKQVFLDAARLAGQAEQQGDDTSVAEALPKLREAGLEIITDVDKAKFIDALQPAYKEWGAKLGEDKIRAIMEYKP